MVYDVEVEFLWVFRVRLAASWVSKVVAGVALASPPLVATVAAYPQSHVGLCLLQLVPGVRGHTVYIPLIIYTRC